MTKEFFDKMFVDACGESKPFNSDTTYELGAEFIGQLAVEDWGCGLGWYRRFAKGTYKGVDGSWSPYADEVADLCEYRSQTPAVFMRNVLEYNPSDWQVIVDNALSSFTERMVLITSHFGVPAPAKIYTRLIDGGSKVWPEVVGSQIIYYLERRS